MEFKTYFAVGWLCYPHNRPVKLCATIQGMKGNEKCIGTSGTPPLPLRSNVKVKWHGTARSLLNHVCQNEKGTSPLSTDMISSCAVASCYRRCENVCLIARRCWWRGHSWFACDSPIPALCFLCVMLWFFFPHPAKTNGTNQISCLAALIQNWSHLS